MSLGRSRAPQGEAAIKAPVPASRTHSLYIVAVAKFKSRRESGRRGGEPLFAVQEAAAAAQGTQRAIEIQSRGNQRPQRGGIARHPAQHLAEVDIAIRLDRALGQ